MEKLQVYYENYGECMSVIGERANADKVNKNRLEVVSVILRWRT